MRSMLFVAAALAIPATAGTAAAQRGGPDGARYGWLASLEAGKAEAKRTGKPLFVAIRCVP